MKQIGEWIGYSIVMLFVIGVCLVQTIDILTLHLDLVIGAFTMIGVIVVVRFFWKQYKNNRRPR